MFAGFGSAMGGAVGRMKNAMGGGGSRGIGPSPGMMGGQMGGQMGAMFGQNQPMSPNPSSQFKQNMQGQPGQSGPNPFAQLSRGLGQAMGGRGMMGQMPPYMQGNSPYNPSQPTPPPSSEGGVAQTQGGPANDPRWTNGTWGGQMGGQMGPSGGLMQQLMQRIQQQGMPGGYKPPQPGDMVSNGWGGQMPYDPNRTAVS